MKKMLVVMIACGMLAACSDTTENSTSKEDVKQEESKPQKESKPKETTAKTAKETPTVDEKQFNMYAGSLTGGTFITTTELKDGNKAIVKYADSFAAYKKENPNSKVTEDSYKNYFGTGEAIQKIMVGEPARLLKQFEGLESVSLTLPFEGKVYTTDITREELNKYLGFKIESLGEDSAKWRSKFSDGYIYNEGKRQEMYNKFVKEGTASVDNAEETAKKEEDQKKAEEQKQAELKKQEAQAKAAEEKRKQEEANRIAEEKRVAEQKQKEQEALQAKQQAEAEQARKEAEEKAQAEAQAQQQRQSQSVSYGNCTEAREAGAAPIYKGQPGYAKHLDRDGDGIGCDK
ncbi:excalibur calcium-binding domain-containing protein [Priestia megaterium]|uniref:excalibur calcium-binding domain-containing protein n=1 Tax=Priestia megaterium TaxID=1404 RepID=UPI002877A82B|nr:excalibur calcium-binding domain-containing protein [Priestia megaterium]